ncbi:hypothetical protein PanWU01x14_041430, partial [Parasponia andersonii]
MHEKCGGSFDDIDGKRDFWNVLSDCDLADLGCVGEQMTWARGQDNGRIMLEHLDREGYVEVIKMVWERDNSEEDVLMFAKKLRRMARAVGKWGFETFGCIPNKIKAISQEIDDLNKDLLGRRNSLNNIEDRNGVWKIGEDHFTATVFDYFSDIFTSLVLDEEIFNPILNDWNSFLSEHMKLRLAQPFNMDD